MACGVNLPFQEELVHGIHSPMQIYSIINRELTVALDSVFQRGAWDVARLRQFIEAHVPLVDKRIDPLHGAHLLYPPFKTVSALMLYPQHDREGVP